MSVLSTIFSSEAQILINGEGPSKTLIENGSEDTFELSRKESSDQTEMSTQTGNGDILVVEYIPYIYSL